LATGPAGEAAAMTGLRHPGYRALHLDELEAVPWKDARLTWRPLRAQLGITAFGAAAFTAAQPGDEVVEPHAEASGGRGQQELYVVARGRARFTLDGQELDAPAGTFVFVEDPAVRRGAVATEPDTAVLVFGGDAGAFTPAGEEVMARVRAALLERDTERAGALAAAGLHELPDSPGVRYALALVAAARGDDEEARRRLAEAIAAVPELAGEARTDPGLARLLDATA
jgi:hypothetical protein